MKPTLDEQDMSVYASDAQTIQEPFGSDYSQGVAVGKTIPAKWWNWLFKAATIRLHQAFSDLTNIFTELRNLILDAGLTPDVTDNTQITQAVVAKTNAQIDAYVSESVGFLTDWTSVSKEHTTASASDGTYYTSCSNKAYLFRAYAAGEYTVLAIIDENGKEYITEMPRISTTYSTGYLDLICCGGAYILRAELGSQVPFENRFLWYTSKDLNSFTNVTESIKNIVVRLDGTFIVLENGGLRYFTYTSNGPSNGRTEYDIDALGTLTRLADYNFTGSTAANLGTDGIVYGLDYEDGFVAGIDYINVTQHNIQRITSNTVARRNPPELSRLRDGSVIINAGRYVYHFTGTTNISPTWNDDTDFIWLRCVRGAGVLVMYTRDTRLIYSYDGVNFVTIDFVFPFAPISIYYNNGTYMMAGYISTDLQNWTALSDERLIGHPIQAIDGIDGAWYSNDVPIGSSHSYDDAILLDNGSFVKYLNLYGTYGVSVDPIVTLSKNSLGTSIIVRAWRHMTINNKTCKLEYYQTQLTKNRVIGHTLYLR